MAKFRFYITDLFEGEIRGTNDELCAKTHAECLDYYVVDSDTGEWLNPEPTPVQDFEGQ
jgi:hypothetical protein